MTADLHIHDVTGDGPLVVLVHGIMDRSTSFARVARHLPDVRVLRYDRRGCGRSVDAGAAPFPVHVDDLLAVLDGRPATVVGHSFGGLVALGAAARPDSPVVAVGAYEPPTPWHPWWPRGSARQSPEDAAERFLRHHIGDDRWERLPVRWRAARRAEGAAMVAELSSVAGDAPPFPLAAVRVPVVLGHGTSSAPHQIRAPQTLADDLHAPLEVLDGAGHDAPATHPGAYAAFVRACLARRSTGPAVGSGVEGAQ